MWYGWTPGAHHGALSLLLLSWAGERKCHVSLTRCDKDRERSLTNYHRCKTQYTWQIAVRKSMIALGEPVQGTLGV